MQRSAHPFNPGRPHPCWPVPLAEQRRLVTVARLALHGLGSRPIRPAMAMDACMIFDHACLRLTEGQYLDMSFEGRADVTPDDYYAMIAGKAIAAHGPVGFATR